MKLDAGLAAVLKEKLLEAGAAASEVPNTGAGPVDPGSDELPCTNSDILTGYHDKCAQHSNATHKSTGLAGT